MSAPAEHDEHLLRPCGCIEPDPVRDAALRQQVRRHLVAAAISGDAWELLRTRRRI